MTIRVLVAASIVWTCVAAVPQQANAQGLWIDRWELQGLPTSGTAWNNLLSHAQASCGAPNLSNQEDGANVCVMAKALVYARTGNGTMRAQVADAISAIVYSGTYSGRALALGRELAAYPISADLIDLQSYDPYLDWLFRQKLYELLTTPTTDGPRNLIDCHERRPNNWGTHCGASRIAAALYLGDGYQLARAAQVFKGWLGDRSSYAGFSYGDLSWQCNPSAPVGINPAGCWIGGVPVDGVLPDDQRRSGSFSWPVPAENYVYEALQGAIVQATLLTRAGYDAFNWEDRAILRAFMFEMNIVGYLAQGDDTWMPHLVNYFYGTVLPASEGARAGKNVGWTDWTHSRAAASGGGGGVAAMAAGSYPAAGDSYVRGGTSGSSNFGWASPLEVKESTSSSTEFHRHAYAQFQMGGGTLSRATLRLYVTGLPNGSGVPLCVFSASDGWDEYGITWGGQPPIGSGLGCQTIYSTGWVSFDVTALVQAEASGDGIVSVMLQDSSKTNKMVRIDSREGSNPPEIVVD